MIIPDTPAHGCDTGGFSCSLLLALGTDFLCARLPRALEGAASLAPPPGCQEHPRPGRDNQISRRGQGLPGHAPPQELILPTRTQSSSRTEAPGGGPCFCPALLSVCYEGWSVVGTEQMHVHSRGSDRTRPFVLSTWLQQVSVRRRPWLRSEELADRSCPWECSPVLRGGEFGNCTGPGHAHKHTPHTPYFFSVVFSSTGKCEVFTCPVASWLCKYLVVSCTRGSDSRGI